MDYKILIYYFILWCYTMDIFVISYTLDLNGFSSKTAYRNSKLHGHPIDLHDLDTCKLVHINALFRHGTRFPGTKDMKKIKLIFNKIMTSKASRHLPQIFLDWRSPFSLDNEKSLTSVGYEEMSLLGRRFKRKFNDINGFKDYINHIKITTSSLSRAKISAVTFANSFLGDEHSTEEIDKLISENDDQLRFFDNCPHYIDSVLNAKSSKAEFKTFLNGPEIRQVIKDIQTKWKLEDIDLTSDDIRTLYIMCGFEIATNVSSTMQPHKCSLSPANDNLAGCPFEPMFDPLETSPLCSLLESAHFPIFEYLYDLKHYWTKSYAKDINWRQSCPLIKPMIQQIIQAARGHQAAVRAAIVSHRPLEYYLDQQTHLRAAFWFGHAETLLPVITLLNLFNQSSPMSATEYKQRLAAINDPRQRFSTFRVSNIAPFAGNVALELYYCPGLAKMSTSSGYRVQVRSNEKAVAWPLANGDSHISLESLVQHVSLCLPEKYDHYKVCVEPSN